MDLPDLPTEGLRDCQIEAINNLEVSFKASRPRALIQMATGSGKTFTAITFIYRLLKFAKARRVLFLVDTRNLGEQAEQEFMSFTPNDDNRKFTELYAVQRLKSSYVATDSQVCISTPIQKQIRKYVRATAQPDLGLAHIKQLIVPVPGQQEQEQIVQEIESRLSICDQLEATITKSLKKAEALRQSILKQAFAGKLVPQDPNDEPAEKLLERIKADRQVKQSKSSEQLKIKGI